jgi:hypothetical protein
MIPIVFAFAIAAQSASLPHLPLDQALAHLRSGVIDFDMVAARDDYSAPKDYHAFSWDERDKAEAALDNHQAATALKLARAGIAHYPFDSDAWAMKAEAEKAQGDEAGFDRDIHIAVAILRAIERTGDGKSPASAWRVINVAEEYALLAVKGLKVEQQGLVEKDGHSFDRMDVTDTSTGEKSTYWFNIDRVFGHEL